MIYYKKKWFLDPVTLVKVSHIQKATLKIVKWGRLGHYFGLENYNFIPLDFGCLPTSYRIYKNKVSIGYVNINSFRNGAVINFVKKGSYSFYYEGIISGKWTLRNDLFLLEGSAGEIYLSSKDYEGSEHLIACGLFIMSKIERDILIIIPFALLLISILVMI